MRNQGIILFGGLSVWLSACATIVEGTDQTVTIITDPAGAECKLERDGVALAVVNPTPNTVQVDKSRKAITVYCQKDGFEDAAATLSSDFQGMTVGNVIFGGIVGVGVDAASGAMNEYPESITIRLEPVPEMNDPEDAESASSPVS